MDRSRRTPSIPPIGNLQTLQDLLLHPSSLEPVFVAMDFEGLRHIVNNFEPRSDAEVGLAILDTRRLSSFSTLATFNFITGTDSYFEKSAPKYRWGIAEKISPKSMLQRIIDCLPRDRNIVLVGHGFRGDLAALKALGFDFQRSSIIAVFDTYRLAQEMGKQLSLGKLLTEMDCPYSRLHNAGNDANFTLRALILLAIKFPGAATEGIETEEAEDTESDELGGKNNELVERVELLRSVAGNQLSSTVKRPKTRKKKLRKKDIAKTWTLEQQEEIREERRRKRENLVLLF